MSELMCPLAGKLDGRALVSGRAAINRANWLAAANVQVGTKRRRRRARQWPDGKLNVSPTRVEQLAGLLAAAKLKQTVATKGRPSLTTQSKWSAICILGKVLSSGRFCCALDGFN